MCRHGVERSRDTDHARGGEEEHADTHGEREELLARTAGKHAADIGERVGVTVLELEVAQDERGPCGVSWLTCGRQRILWSRRRKNILLTCDDKLNDNDKNDARKDTDGLEDERDREHTEAERRLDHEDRGADPSDLGISHGRGSGGAARPSRVTTESQNL